MKTGNFWVVHARGSYHGRSFDEHSAAIKKADELRAKSIPVIMISKHAYEAPLLFSGYTPKQTLAIQDAIILAKADAIKMDGWQSCHYSEQLISAGGTRYAVFGPVAYELPNKGIAGDENTVFESLPVLVNGKAFRIDPEDGSGGIMILMRCTKKNGQPCETDWIATYHETSWVYVSELETSIY